MTCIAYKDGVIAADSAVSEEGTLLGSMYKLTRAPDGSLAGACSGISSIAVFLRWFHKGRRGAKPQIGEDKDFGGITISPDSTVTQYDAAMQSFIIHSEFHALGSGAAVALGAMAAGADAVEAVRIACRFNAYCRAPIYALRLDGEPHELESPI